MMAAAAAAAVACLRQQQAWQQQSSSQWHPVRALVRRVLGARNGDTSLQLVGTVLAWHIHAVPSLSNPLPIFSGPAWAGGRDKVGEFQASGFLFKDTVEVTALDDPDGGRRGREGVVVWEGGTCGWWVRVSRQGL